MPQRPAVPQGKVARMPGYKVSHADLTKAQRKARKRNTTFSKVLREFIRRYGAGEVQG